MSDKNIRIKISEDRRSVDLSGFLVLCIVLLPFTLMFIGVFLSHAPTPVAIPFVTDDIRFMHHMLFWIGALMILIPVIVILGFFLLVILLG